MTAPLATVAHYSYWYSSQTPISSLLNFILAGNILVKELFDSILLYK